MKTLLKRIAVVLAAAVLAACGGGSGGGTCLYTACQSDGTAVASDLSVVLDKTSIGNSGSEVVTVTVTALDSSGRVVPGAAVSFDASTGGGRVIAPASNLTGATGQIAATVGMGDDRSNRVITIKATSGTVTRSRTLSVTGAKVVGTISGGAATVVAGSQVVVAYKVTDTAAVGMPAQPLTVSGGIASATGATDVNGEYSLTFTAPLVAGEYAINANSAGASTSNLLTVVGATGGVVVGPVTPNLAIGRAAVTLNKNVVEANSDGATANRVDVTALFSGAGNQALKNVRVRFDLAGDANNVGGTFTSGSTTPVYSLDDGAVTVAYVPAAKESPTNGVTIRACYGRTDAEALDPTCPNAATATLTVVSRPVSISIGTNGVLINNGLTYSQDFVVSAVDASGVAKPDVLITPSIDILRYAKGFWYYTGTRWSRVATQDFEANFSTTSVPDVRPIYLEDPRPAAHPGYFDAFDHVIVAPAISSSGACWNENRNRQSVVPSLFDSAAVAYSFEQGGNGNGRADPEKADIQIQVVDGATKTNASGQMIVRITYAKDLGRWLEYKITAVGGGVTGTESRSTRVGILEVANADVTSEVQPAFAINKYGKLAGCNNPQ